MIAYKQCCICDGPTTYLTSQSAFIVVNRKEFRVHYHESCFANIPDAKETITKLLNDMAKNG